MDEREFQGLEHIRKLLKDSAVPNLEGELTEIPLMRELHEDITAIRNIAHSFSTGDISPTIQAKGIISGCLKTFQTRLQNEVSQQNSMLEALQKSESRFKYLASHDPLTGALNRRSFLERAAGELQIAETRNIPCCLAIMDIDHFKRFNDTFGHVAGDEALRHTVRVISAILRKNDFMGRYGGEEFVLLFNGADKIMGFNIAERVRSSLEASRVSIDTGEQSITASFGVSMAGETPYRNSEDHLQDLINYADIALYHAKQTGRNQVICYRKEMDQHSFNSLSIMAK
ncbi:MAG: GGDEF domain-containing protein [Treponema sp.]|jgi:diguanylate cyclase (GGDEF)-like protein|nr:GGDEF domain-containing protein [Treponema sp.]